MFKYLVMKRFDDVERTLNRIWKEVKKMSQELDDLTVEVAEMATVVDSAILLIEGLAARLEEIADDPAAIRALAVELDTKAAELAAAVAANPVPPAPEPEPVP